MRLRPLLCLVFLCVLGGWSVTLGQQKDTGVLPVGADGKPLNLDFETGTLRDWTVTGDAEIFRPIKGDTVFPRRNDSRSRHQGEYWIGGYERKGDKPKGTLTSAPFKITHRWASFLVGGGPHDTTCVELVFKDSGKVFHRASGLEEEDLKREVVDLTPHQGKEMFVRVVDKHSGHWGHVNFDDFRFHTNKPTFPTRPSKLDTFQHDGLAPKDAARAMTVPEGFHVTLFAGEPDVRQPIAFCLDDRGRLWVAEAYSYPVRRPEKQAKDRILIFEDTDGDGTFDKRTVFMDKLNLVSGLEVGFGGVWIGAAPEFLFVPVKEGEDKPAGPPQVLLDGWGYQDTHETLNTFTWGPDGWLYGCHGVFTHSKVGKPDTPDAQRTRINAGVWRYHPMRHVFEVFAHGTSNPWGLDFNDRGQAFVEACVIPHNWHIIQGGRYQRQAGSHFNPFTFDDIKTIAVHRHYVGATPHGGNNRSDSVGGGHAHCGTMIYLGDRWPAKYRDQMFMGNIHGRRLNVDVLQPKGSGYLADRAPDFLFANDARARFINLQPGPDGNVYLIDWYDQQACHTNNQAIWDRDTGRIYKISYGKARAEPVDLRKKSNAELAALQLHPNDWHVRHARRILQERQAKDAHEALATIALDNADETRRLRGLWALHVTGGLTRERLDKALADKSGYVRGWAVQLALEDGKADDTLRKKFAQMAAKDNSAVTRLYLASGMQRLPLAQRWEVLEALVARAEDANDHNQPLMVWYAAEPLAEVDPSRALALANKSRLPTVLPFMVRRISAAGSEKAVGLLVDALGTVESETGQSMYLQGIRDGLRGQQKVSMPATWKATRTKLFASANPEMKLRAAGVGVVFGDVDSLIEMRRLLSEEKEDLARRREALESLVEARDEPTAAVLQGLVKGGLRNEAIRGLAAFADGKTPTVLLGVYGSLDSAGKREAVNTLASRPAYGKALLDAVAAKKLPASDLSADVVRQLGNLRDKVIDQRLAEVWGVVRATPADRLKAIAAHKTMLTRKTKTPPDLALGRALFNKTCAQCHTLFGVGGKVGPELTGSNRTNLDYLLENILAPSAVIPKEYTMTVFTLRNGRVITGITREETPAAVTVATPTETIVVSKKDLEERQASDVSMMPDDALKGLNEHAIRSLIAYLGSPTQTPVLATVENARDLFNGKDLTGWVGDAKLWRVDKGEIVGSTTGLKHNAFLRSEMVTTDFHLTVMVKLTPNKENSGIQFRSEALPGGDVKGPQADIGAGWWGKLYEEHGRGLLWKDSGEAHVKVGDWNVYEIEAVGTRVRTRINGKLCVDLEDGKIARRGIFALQLHSGGAMEVRFKEMRLEVLTK